MSVPMTTPDARLVFPPSARPQGQATPGSAGGVRSFSPEGIRTRSGVYSPRLTQTGPGYSAEAEGITTLVRHTSTTSGGSAGGGGIGAAAAATPTQRASTSPTMHRSFGSGSASVVRSASPKYELEALKKMVTDRDTEIAVRAEQHRQQIQDLQDALHRAGEELALSKHRCDALRGDAQELQRREQAAVAAQDATQRQMNKLTQELQDVTEEADRLRQNLRSRTDDARRAEETCATRAKELSVMTLARNRAEKRASQLQSDLDEMTAKFEKLRTSSSAKVEQVTKQAERAQSQLQEATTALQRVTGERDLLTGRITAELHELSRELDEARAAFRAVHGVKEQLEAKVREQEELLAQCDATMTSLDEENKSLLESNNALRANSERLGANFCEQNEQLAALKQTCDDAIRERDLLRATTPELENSVRTLTGDLAHVRGRLAAVELSLEETLKALESERQSHHQTLGEMQLAHVTLKRQREEDLQRYRETVATLEGTCDQLRRDGELQRINAERLLLTTVAEREAALLLSESTRRQELLGQLQKEHEHDPRIQRNAALRAELDDSLERLTRLRAYLSHEQELQVPADEERRRAELEEYAMYLVSVLSFTACEVPRHFEGLLSRQRSEIETLQRRLVEVERDAANSAAELSLLEDDRRRLLTSTRPLLVKGLGELLLRSMLTRRRWRSLFALPSWRAMLHGHVIPDDLGEMLCEIVEDFHAILEKHRELCLHCLTPQEREQWGFAVGSGESSPRSASRSQQQNIHPLQPNSVRSHTATNRLVNAHLEVVGARGDKWVDGDTSCEIPESPLRRL